MKHSALVGRVRARTIEGRLYTPRGAFERRRLRKLVEAGRVHQVAATSTSLEGFWAPKETSNA